MDDLANIWNMIAPYVTNGAVFSAIASILGACIARAIKKSTTATTTALNTKIVANELKQEMKKEIKEISFEQNIQPLVQSELKKVTEEANTYLKQQLKETQEGYNKLLLCVEKLSAYFDNSIGVSDEAKAELKQAIADAKIPETPSNQFTTTVIVEEVAQEQPKKAKKSAEIER